MEAALERPPSDGKSGANGRTQFALVNPTCRAAASGTAVQKHALVFEKARPARTRAP